MTPPEFASLLSVVVGVPLGVLGVQGWMWLRRRRERREMRRRLLADITRAARARRSVLDP